MTTRTIYILLLFAIVKSAKILMVVPSPSISHQVVFRPLIQELINHDHEVTVITTDPVYPHGKAHNNLTEIDVHNLSYTHYAKLFKEIKNIDLDDFVSKLTVAYHLLSEVFEKQLMDKSVQALITDKTFDLLMLEACATPALIFSHIFKAPVILISSFGANPGNMEVIGTLTHPFLYPTHFHRRIYNLTMLEKINELHEHVLIDRMLQTQELKDDRMLQRHFGINVPRLNELKNNVHMLCLNVHPIWLHNQPVPPSVVYTRGIHKTSEKRLPKDLQSYLDSSKNGVIYISFGTNFKTSSMPSVTLDILLKVLSRLPYNVLWKWDADELPGKPENIKIAKWLPQTDVLRHPNLKLFITQAGLQSTDEAIKAGVPLIGIPTFADQEYNSEKYEYFKIGVKLKFKSLTVERLENAINTIFSQYDSYKENIIYLRNQIQDLPKPPLETAIWWIEYVLHHGGARQLRSTAARMSWAEYYELELVFLLLSGLMVLVALLLLLVNSVIKCTSRIVNLQNNKTRIV